MPFANILLITSKTEIGVHLERSILQPAGYEVLFISEIQLAIELPKRKDLDLVLLGEEISGQNGLSLAAQFSALYPSLPIIFLVETKSLEPSLGDYGIWNTLTPPYSPESVLTKVRQTLERSRNMKESLLAESKRSHIALQRRLDALETLQHIGRSVASSLDLDGILSSVVDAAVDMTSAEEGSLLLLDESTGDLYMRAARNFHDDFVRRFRLPIRDSLAGQVMRTGKPLAINVNEPQKIKTSYLIHTLIYVPLSVHNRVIGVLGVDNRQSGHGFQEDHLGLLTTLADYAAIAIENARTFSVSDAERKKLETVLTKIEDGVIIIDHDGRILFVNQTVRNIFGIKQENLLGKLAEDIFTHPELLDIFEAQKDTPYRTELTIDDVRVFNTQVTPINEVGLVLTMQDITHLKELNRIKSEFVASVSHDLRSPLTAILGYIDLIERVGPVTPQQREFIQRVQINVQNITELINDLLDLGRIEAGFDARKEIVHLSAVLKLAIDHLESFVRSRRIDLEQDIAENIPTILGNPSRLFQMATNLLSNAIKFSPPGGKVTVKASMEANQVIIQITDQGPGIPIADQPFIFDKFYRASNVPPDTAGSGLGLAIVQSIVQSHEGRIWVRSTLGEGASFTVVLPVIDLSS
jgi:two-component system, OmpR family, phosphate regulon sensor histidine kinase PhoR